MAIVWQLAGKMVPDQLDPLREEFARLQGHLGDAPGFLRAELLVNRSTNQVQFLTYWNSFEEAVAFHKARGTDYMQPFKPYVEEAGTVILSVLEHGFVRAA